jgi:hypothetical protein
MKATNSQIIEALKKTGGFRSQAARLLNITPSALTRRLTKSAELKQADAKIRNETLDLAESKLISLIQSGSFPAIKYYLEHKGQDRGYGVKQAHKQPLSSPVALAPSPALFYGIPDGLRAALITTLLEYKDGAKDKGV